MKFLTMLLIGISFAACKNKGISIADITCAKNGEIHTYLDQPWMFDGGKVVVMTKEYPMGQIDIYPLSSCDIDHIGKVARDEYKYSDQ